MKEQKQKIVDGNIGDCFRACMASLLELPIDVLPNDHSPGWFGNWQHFLSQFGLSIKFQHGENSPIWMSEPWIGQVKSKNFKDGSHVILMHNGGQVLFDPSTKKKFRKGSSLLGKKVVTGGYCLIVKDASDLHRLKEYRDRLTKGK